MKNLAIAALVGFLSFEDVQASMDEYVFVPVPETLLQKSDDTDSDSDESSDDESLVQAQDYPAYMSGFGGYHTYMRDTPDRFETEADDTLMKSMYATYATEGEADHLPTGRFWVTKENAMKAADEVVNTHLRLKKDEKKAYLDA